MSPSRQPLGSPESLYASDERRAVLCCQDGQPPPLYMDFSEGKGKPKWKLVQGVGPPGLEIDSSRSGRLFKPNLRQYGIEGPMYKPLEEGCALTLAEHSQISEVGYCTVLSSGSSGPLLEQLFG